MSTNDSRELARTVSGAIVRTTGQARYIGQRAIAPNGPPVVERAIGDAVSPLDVRRDLAPGLPIAFDWGPLGSRARAERLAVAILVDALGERPDADELALRHFREFARQIVDRFDDAIFAYAAIEALRWLANQEHGRAFHTTSRVPLPRGAEQVRTA